MVTDVVGERLLVNGHVCTPSMRLNHMRVCKLKLCIRNHTLHRNTTRGNKKALDATTVHNLLFSFYHVYALA